jgi:cytochrome P450
MNEHVQTATTEPLFNPLAPEFIRDPYPHYERLRTTDPMHLTPLGMFVASRHAEASFVLRDKRFGKDYVERSIRRYGPQVMEEPVFRSMSHWMLQQDPPDHTRLRGLVVKAFTARRVEDMRPRIQQVVDQTLDAIAGQGHMDLIEDFAFRLPVTIICDMLGIPEDHREVFYKSSRDGGRLLDPVPLSRAEIEQANAGNAMAQMCRARNHCQPDRKRVAGAAPQSRSARAAQGQSLPDHQRDRGIFALRLLGAVERPGGAGRHR